MKLKSLSRIRTDRKCGEMTQTNTQCQATSSHMTTFTSLHQRFNRYPCRQHAAFVALRELPGIIDERNDLKVENERLKFKIHELEEKIVDLKMKYYE